MLRILVVDDEAPTREWFIYCIKKASDEFEVVGSASNGDEAMKMIIKLNPDVVITDIRMPGMDGLELMGAIKKCYPHIDFIVLTSFAEFDYARMAVKHGAVEYLLKTEIKQNDVLQILQALAKKRYDTENLRDAAMAKERIEKEEMIEKIVTGVSERQILREYAFKMGLKGSETYLVLAVRKNNYNIASQSVETIQNRYVHLDVYHYSKGHKLFILIKVMENGKELMKENLLKEIIYEISEKVAQSIGVSDKHQSIDFLDRAFKEASLALNNDFFSGSGSVNFFSKLSKVSNLDVRAINSFFKSFLDSLNYYQGERVLEYSDKIFMSLENGTVDDIIFVRKMCRSMIILLEEKAGMLKNDIEDKSYEIEDFIDIKYYRSRVEKIVTNLYRETDKNFTPAIRNAINYIEKNYYKQISLTAIAKYVHLSNEYFSRLFKQETGQNFSIYLMVYRLKKAKELLDTTGLKVSEVAEKVGFQNFSYFSQMYKKYMGVNATIHRNHSP